MSLIFSAKCCLLCGYRDVTIVFETTCWECGAIYCRECFSDECANCREIEREKSNQQEAVLMSDQIIILEMKGKKMTDEVEMPNYCSGFAWGLDFCRALNERNWFWRLLFRLAVGKYAYTEFKGLWDEINKQGFPPYFDYDLEDIAYHTAGNIRGPDWAYFPFVHCED